VTVSLHGSKRGGKGGGAVTNESIAFVFIRHNNQNKIKETTTTTTTTTTSSSNNNDKKNHHHVLMASPACSSFLCSCLLVLLLPWLLVCAVACSDMLVLSETLCPRCWTKREVVCCWFDFFLIQIRGCTDESNGCVLPYVIVADHIILRFVGRFGCAYFNQINIIS
jgi:hypothetical protein